MDIEVKIGEVAITTDRDHLIASGVGSCVAVTLYDPSIKIGAMAHAMLPGSRKSCSERNSSNVSPKAKYSQRSPATPLSKAGDTKYVDIAIEEMLRMMVAKGAKRKDLEAKIVGGANMFSAFESDIGRDNVLKAKEKLKREGIRIVGECVGGSQGRSVEFSPPSGIVTVKTKF